MTVTSTSNYDLRPPSRLCGLDFATRKLICIFISSLYHNCRRVLRHTGVPRRLESFYEKVKLTSCAVIQMCHKLIPVMTVGCDPGALFYFAQWQAICDGICAIPQILIYFEATHLIHHCCSTTTHDLRHLGCCSNLSRRHLSPTNLTNDMLSRRKVRMVVNVALRRLKHAVFTFMTTFLSFRISRPLFTFPRCLA